MSLNSATTADQFAEATREEMRDARLPLAYRDSCGHLLIPLNKCRRETFYAPWKCGVRSLHNPLFAVTGVIESVPRAEADELQDERHSYEKCQYDEFKKRVAKMDELRESKGGARSN